MWNNPPRTWPWQHILMVISMEWVPEALTVFGKPTQRKKWLPGPWGPRFKLKAAYSGGTVAAGRQFCFSVISRLSHLAFKLNMFRTELMNKLCLITKTANLISSRDVYGIC